MVKQCKNCKYGKENKRTGTVYCNLLDRTLIFNRADKCEYYEDSTLIKNLKAKGKYKGDA